RGVERNDRAAGALFFLAADQGNAAARKALDFIRPQDTGQLPSCMAPDPLPLPSVEVARLGDEAVPTQAEEEPYPGPEGPVRELVRSLAPGFGVDPRLALAIISAESAFNPMAVSPKNAQGLMQLIPDTATRFGVRKILDPAENIRGGLSYL